LQTSSFPNPHKKKSHCVMLGLLTGNVSELFIQPVLHRFVNVLRNRFCATTNPCTFFNDRVLW
jgi:hypothetical protein